MSKEIQQITKKIGSLAAGERAILATVVDVVGSGYRRPGARMLIDRHGYAVGTVSGGCLEADVLERAKKVLETSVPTVITYDTTTDENSVFGLGMGCRGIVRILLEPISTDSFFYNYIRDAVGDRKTISLATLINPANGDDCGARLFFEENGAAHSDFGEVATTELFSVIRRVLYEKTTEVRQFGFGETFLETIQPPLALHVFGAGYDALPLIKFAKELGWRVAAIDHRAAFADAARLAEADEIHHANLSNLSDDFFEDENSAAVVMTHNLERDRAILPRLLRANYQYIGALGPRRRTEKILAEAGGDFTAEQLAKLHAPVGLDIGADTPEAIALAIVAEIQAVLKKRAGGFLRERQGSIYARNE